MLCDNYAVLYFIILPPMYVSIPMVGFVVLQPYINGIILYIFFYDISFAQDACQVAPQQVAESLQWAGHCSASPK